MLSRFTTGKREKEILNRLEDGSLDVIIGTHKLLGKRIKLKNLGLAVIDEEQKFGVNHKKIHKVDEKRRRRIDALGDSYPQNPAAFPRRRKRHKRDKYPSRGTAARRGVHSAVQHRNDKGGRGKRDRKRRHGFFHTQQDRGHIREGGPSPKTHAETVNRGNARPNERNAALKNHRTVHRRKNRPARNHRDSGIRTRYTKSQHYNSKQRPYYGPSGSLSA